MNMPCTTLNEMAEVTDKIFTPAGTETIPLPPIFVYSNVIDHLALRGSLRHFDTQSNRFTEGFVTDEVTAYIETMFYIVTTMKNKKPNTATVFVSPPGYIHLPRALQQFLYLVLEAAYARDLHFYIVAPNLRISVTTWRPCEASYPAFLAKVSKAIQAFTGYRGNSQLIVDEATAYDYGMQMSIRSLDENGVRKVLEPNENERKHLIDVLWFERRDESTLDEKTHEPKFHKALLALFKETEKIKTERTNSTVFPMAAISTDAKLDMASLTLTLLTVMTRGLARQNEAEPSHTYQTWHKALHETLNQVALRLEIPFPVFLYNISPFWLPSFVQAEFNLDDQQTRLYQEAMQKTTISEILAYLMAVGMHTMYKGPSGILQKLIFDKGHLPLFSYLVFSQNQKNWLQAILNALDPAGPLRLKRQLELNIEAILVWIYSTWVNVAGIMHPLDENPAINREPNQLPGFLFPSQMATLMLVETEDLMPLIAPIVWPIFGAVMALRYPTQVLRMAVNTPTFSILHFVMADETLAESTYRRVIASFSSMRPPMAYTIIKDKKQVEHNFTSIIKARARCALPMPMEFHPIAWLHIPLNPATGAAHSLAGWNSEIILRILATAIQRLGGRRRGEESSGLRYPYVCDASRMYCDRNNPRAHSSNILQATTCWSKPDLVDFAVHQTSQRMKAKTPSVAKEPNKKTLPINTEVPNNPRAALEIFLNLHSRQKEKGDSVGEEYERGIQTFKSLFMQHGYPELADKLPEFPQGNIIEQSSATNTAAPGNSQQETPSELPAERMETRMEENQKNLSIVTETPDEPMTDDNFTLSDGATPTQDEPETGISQMDAADIKSELNNLLTIDDSIQYPPLVAESSINQESAVTSSVSDSQQSQNDE